MPRARRRSPRPRRRGAAAAARRAPRRPARRRSASHPRARPPRRLGGARLPPRAPPAPRCSSAGAAPVPMRRLHRGRALRGRSSRAASTPPAYRLRFRFADGAALERDDPYRFLPDARRARPAPARRGHAPAALREARRAPARPSTASRASPSPSGRPTRGASAWSATSTAGTAALHPMRALGGSGIWELFVPGLGRGDALQVRDRRPRRRAARSRPTRSPSPPSCARRPPSVVFDHDALRLGRRRRGWQRAPDASRAREPDRDLRGAPRLLDARRAARAAAGSPTASSPPRLADYVRRPRLHPRRAAAGRRAPVRRLLGLPGRPATSRPPRRFGTPDDFKYFVDRCTSAASA